MIANRLYKSLPVAPLRYSAAPLRNSIMSTSTLRKRHSTAATLAEPLASDAYLNPITSISSKATTSTPTLSPSERKILERIIRVDQAGELGANWIYKGQLAILKNKPELAELIQHMWDQEKKHIQTFDKLITQHQVRPTLLYPLWKLAGYTLGAGTALLGRESAMACTEAVETVIGEHYNDQIKSLETFPLDSHPSLPLLRNILKEFREDELEHLDTAVENDSQKAPGHALLSAMVAVGCRGAIYLSERV